MVGCLLTSVLWSSASAQIEVTTGGNVGIGTTSPTAKLTVEAGNIGIDGNNSAQQFFGAAGNLAGTNTAGGVITVFGHSPNAYGDVSAPPYNGSSFVGAAGLIARGFSEASQYRGSLEFFTETAGVPASRMIITHNGNVGIGTTSPYAQLEVHASNRAPAAFYMPRYYYVYLVGSDSTNGAAGLAFATKDGNGVQKTGYVTQDSDGSMYFLTDANPRVRITATGDVGIGTTTPGYKLEVAGSVRATSFIANANTYADFVFKPGYQLASLTEVEQHIKEHGTLPGVPSEAQVAKEGIDLTAMQVKLLQKVEELTLHVIAQEKRIHRLEEENSRLKTQP